MTQPTHIRPIVDVRPGNPVVVDIEFNTASGFDGYTEEVTYVGVTDGGVLILQHENGSVSAVNPTGWTRVSKR